MVDPKNRTKVTLAGFGHLEISYRVDRTRTVWAHRLNGENELFIGFGATQKGYDFLRGKEDGKERVDAA